MGGKTGTQTQTLQIPPEVLERYRQVNKRAEDVANRPFQKYSTDPSAFVAQINEQQQRGIGNINQYANYAQPSIEYAQAGYRPENFGAGVQGYLNPFMEGAVGATAAQLENINQQQQAAQRGSQIGKGAFGGDRAGVGMANLINQQNLATGQTLGQMRAQGYQDAARNYMAGLGQIGTLGLQGQDAFMRGAQSQVGAGTLQQQTEQAGKTALYNQFMQEQAYPFQVAQFLANIAMGTGALSGNTTTTTYPMGFFSDERLKEDIKTIGKTFDGQDIIKYRYKDSPETHIGLSAQQTEKHHPEAVGLLAGFKTVDYDKATKDAASMGGGVAPSSTRKNYEDGGLAMPYASSVGDIVPRSLNIPVSPPSVKSLATPSGNIITPKSGLSEVSDIADLISTGTKAYDWYKDPKKSWNKVSKDTDTNADKYEYASGGLIPREEDEKDGEGKTSLDIPDDPVMPGGSTMSRPGDVQKPSSGLSELASMASIAKVGMDVLPAILGFFSDERLKEDIQPIGKTFEGQNIIKFRYKDSPETRIGLSAQETEKYHPEAVGLLGGYKTVNYDMATKDSERDRPLSWMPAMAAGGLVTRRHRLLGGADEATTEKPEEEEGLAAADTTAKAAIEPSFENIMEASRRGIKRLESGGDYSIKGKPTVRKDPATGATYEDVPLGAYQVMKSNLPSWSKEAFGKEVTEDEFLNNPEIQDKLFDYKFGSYVKKHGNPLDAASMWLSGKPLKDAVSAGDKPDILGTKPSSYVDAFAQYSGLGAAKAAEPTSDRQAPSEGGLGGLSEMMSGFLPESNEGKLALLAGVFGALASPNPTLLGAIGQGGLTGVKTYSDLIKVRNESMKYNMDMIKDRFVTLDGQTYQDRWGVLPPMDRSEMGAYVKQTLSRSGLGGGLAGAPDFAVKAPTVEAPSVAAPAVDKAIETAKTVTTESKPKPDEEPTKSVEEAGQSAGQTLDFSKAKSETEIKQMILNNPDSWKGVDNNLNPRWLYDQAAKQREAMQAYQAQAAAAASNPFGQANVERLKTLAENARISMDDYNKRADTALTSASASAISEFNKMNELSRETTEVVDPVTGAKRTITKAEQVRLSREGKSPMVEQAPAIVKRLEEIAADDAKLREAAVKRPKMRAALDAIAGLLEKFETGRFADIKADAVGYLVGLGVPIDPKVAQNTTSMDELIKYANTQTLAMMSQLGAKFTNMELSNISQTVSGPKITPEANAEIVASALAAADADDKIWNDYLTWREKNPNDPFPDAHFEKPWLEANKSFLSDRKKDYLKKIAPKGMQLPPPNDPSKWVDGKRYNTPKGVFIWNAEKGRLIPEGAQ